MIHIDTSDREPFIRYPGGKVPLNDLTVDEGREAIRWMEERINDPEYWANGPDCSTTLLAENCCAELALYINDDIPDDLFEIAYGVDSNERYLEEE